jgi:hypothetical protein
MKKEETHMDSLIVDPIDARMQFAMMTTERLDAQEDQMLAATSKLSVLAEKVASLEVQIASLKSALRAQPRPDGYYIHLEVPQGTTRQQVEEGLKAAWDELKLATDGVFRTGFCVAVTRSYKEDTGDYHSTCAHVFVFGAKCLMPHQATSWVMSSVADSKMRYVNAVTMIWFEAEMEYFRERLFDHDTWALYPLSKKQGWTKEPMQPLCDEGECDVEEWMQQTFVYGMPWVSVDGEEFYVV